MMDASTRDAKISPPRRPCMDGQILQATAIFVTATRMAKAAYAFIALPEAVFPPCAQVRAEACSTGI